MAQAETAVDTDRANQEAFDRLCKSEPILVDVRQAIEVVPGMTKETLLTSGPPMAWGDYMGGQRAALIHHIEGVCKRVPGVRPTSAA